MLNTIPLFSLFLELLPIIGRSLWISVLGVLFAAIIALPVAVGLSSRTLHGQRYFVALMQAFMAMPPVLVGLVLYVLFRPQGLFGGAGLLYTLTIMIIAQAVLAFPIIFSLAYEGLVAVHERFGVVFRIYPHQPRLRLKMTLREARLPIATALIAGFGRTMAEVGAVLIVGGNIQGLTQVMTTLVVQDTQQGRIDRALIVGAILFSFAVLVTFLTFSWRHQITSLRHD